MCNRRIHIGGSRNFAGQKNNRVIQFFCFFFQVPDLIRHGFCHPAKSEIGIKTDFPLWARLRINDHMTATDVDLDIGFEDCWIYFPYRISVQLANRRLDFDFPIYS